MSRIVNAMAAAMASGRPLGYEPELWLIGEEAGKTLLQELRPLYLAPGASEPESLTGGTFMGVPIVGCPEPYRIELLRRRPAGAQLVVVIYDTGVLS